jgi:hypothetical protein
MSRSKHRQNLQRIYDASNTTSIDHRPIIYDWSQ